MIRGESNDDDCVDPVMAQVAFQLGSDKSAVHVFAVDGFASLGSRNRLNGIAGRLRAKQTVGFH
jgi:hypothetical protein